MANDDTSRTFRKRCNVLIANFKNKIESYSRRGFLYAVVSMGLFCLSGKVNSFSNVHMLHIISYALQSLLAVSSSLTMCNLLASIPKPTWGFIVLAAFMNSLPYFLLEYSILLISLADISFILVVQIFFVAVLPYCFLNQPVKFSELVFALLTFIGIMFSVRPPLLFHSYCERPLPFLIFGGVIGSLSVAFLNSCSMIIIGHFKEVPATSILIFQSIITLMFSLSTISGSGSASGINGANPDALHFEFPVGLWFSAIGSGILTYIAWILMIWALQLEERILVSLLMSLKNPLCMLLTVLCHRKLPDLAALPGIILLLIPLILSGCGKDLVKLIKRKRNKMSSNFDEEKEEILQSKATPLSYKSCVRDLYGREKLDGKDKCVINMENETSIYIYKDDGHGDKQDLHPDKGMTIVELNTAGIAAAKSTDTSANFYDDCYLNKTRANDDSHNLNDILEEITIIEKSIPNIATEKKNVENASNLEVNRKLETVKNSEIVHKTAREKIESIEKIESKENLQTPIDCEFRQRPIEMVARSDETICDRIIDSMKTDTGIRNKTKQNVCVELVKSDATGDMIPEEEINDQLVSGVKNSPLASANQKTKASTDASQGNTVFNEIDDLRRGLPRLNDDLFMLKIENKTEAKELIENYVKVKKSSKALKEIIKITHSERILGTESPIVCREMESHSNLNEEFTECKEGEIGITTELQFRGITDVGKAIPMSSNEKESFMDSMFNNSSEIKYGADSSKEISVNNIDPKPTKENEIIRLAGTLKTICDESLQMVIDGPEENLARLELLMFQQDARALNQAEIRPDDSTESVPSKNMQPIEDVTPIEENPYSQTEASLKEHKSTENTVVEQNPGNLQEKTIGNQTENSTNDSPESVPLRSIQQDFQAKFTCEMDSTEEFAPEMGRNICCFSEQSLNENYTEQSATEMMEVSQKTGNLQERSFGTKLEDCPAVKNDHEATEELRDTYRHSFDTVEVKKLKEIEEIGSQELSSFTELLQKPERNILKREGSRSTGKDSLPRSKSVDFLKMGERRIKENEKSDSSKKSDFKMLWLEGAPSNIIDVTTIKADKELEISEDSKSNIGGKEHETACIDIIMSSLIKRTSLKVENKNICKSRIPMKEVLDTDNKSNYDEIAQNINIPESQKKLFEESILSYSKYSESSQTNKDSGKIPSTENNQSKVLESESRTFQGVKFKRDPSYYSKSLSSDENKHPDEILCEVSFPTEDYELEHQNMTEGSNRYYGNYINSRSSRYGSREFELKCKSETKVQCSDFKNNISRIPSKKMIWNKEIPRAHSTTDINVYQNTLSKNEEIILPSKFYSESDIFTKKKYFGQRTPFLGNLDIVCDTSREMPEKETYQLKKAEMKRFRRFSQIENETVSENEKDLDESDLPESLSKRRNFPGKRLVRKLSKKFNEFRDSIQGSLDSTKDKMEDSTVRSEDGQKSQNIHTTGVTKNRNTSKSLKLLKIRNYTGDMEDSDSKKLGKQPVKYLKIRNLNTKRDPEDDDDLDEHESSKKVKTKRSRKSSDKSTIGIPQHSAQGKAKTEDPKTLRKSKTTKFSKFLPRSRRLMTQLQSEDMVDNESKSDRRSDDWDDNIQNLKHGGSLPKECETQHKDSDQKQGSKNSRDISKQIRNQKFGFKAITKVHYRKRRRSRIKLKGRRRKDVQTSSTFTSSDSEADESKEKRLNKSCTPQ